MTRIAILGAGKIGESLLAGLLSSGWTDVVATARREEHAEELRSRHDAPTYAAVKAQLATRLHELQGCAGASCRDRP